MPRRFGDQSGLFLLCQKLASLPISQVNFPCRWLFGRLPGEIVIGFNRPVTQQPDLVAMS
jgi:hypothetical protein